MFIFGVVQSPVFINLQQFSKYLCFLNKCCKKTKVKLVWSTVIPQQQDSFKGWN